MSYIRRLQRVLAVSRVECMVDTPSECSGPQVTHLGFFSNDRIACEQIKTYCTSEGTEHLKDLENDDLKADDSIKIHELELKNFHGRAPKVGYVIAHMSNGYSGLWPERPVPPRLAFIGNCCYRSRSEAKVALKHYKKKGHWKMDDTCFPGRGWVSRRFNEGMGYDEDSTHFFEIIKFELDRSQDWDFEGEEEVEEVVDEEIELYINEFWALATDFDNGDKDYIQDWFSEDDDDW